MNADTRWQKSSFSGAEGPNCVEVATCTNAILLRESDAPTAVIAAARAEVRALITRIKEGALQ
ncbi:DUF397 domain-containing protein [Streptomyces abikoensis]|uniref:DUF397 domain-containing protein n=1 Tax=Streptomyces abikoensis TaxID=97398 RepID=UPI00371D587F